MLVVGKNTSWAYTTFYGQTPKGSRYKKLDEIFAWFIFSHPHLCFVARSKSRTSRFGQSSWLCGPLKRERERKKESDGVYKIYYLCKAMVIHPVVVRSNRNLKKKKEKKSFPASHHYLWRLQKTLFQCLCPLPTPTAHGDKEDTSKKKREKKTRSGE